MYNMKVCYCIVFLIFLLQVSCFSQKKDTKEIANRLTFEEHERPLVVLDEEGRKFVRIVSIKESLGGGNPVYECKCKTSGNCCEPKGRLPTGFIECVCESGCPPPTGDLNNKISGCAFEKVSSVSPFVEGQLIAAEQYLRAGLPDFNESGFRAISPSQLELQNKDVDYTNIQLSDGTKGILFKSTGVRVQCNCTCPNEGVCETIPLGLATLACKTTTENTCRAEINGAVCAGCAWVTIPDNVKTVHSIDPHQGDHKEKHNDNSIEKE